jgi:hypothetical protein
MDADADGYLDAARPDLREIAAGRPAPTQGGRGPVPSAGEAAACLAWAKQVLDEVDARTAADARLAERDTQLARWHADDHPDDHADSPADDLGDGAGDGYDVSLLDSSEAP